MAAKVVAYPLQLSFIYMSSKILLNILFWLSWSLLLTGSVRAEYLVNGITIGGYGKALGGLPAGKVCDKYFFNHNIAVTLITAVVCTPIVILNGETSNSTSGVSVSDLLENGVTPEVADKVSKGITVNQLNGTFPEPKTTSLTSAQ
jgi:uncharacterized membrane-anchored protein YitT (DUF2179 family)